VEVGVKPVFELEDEVGEGEVEELLVGAGVASAAVIINCAVP
jgi:hypothetical protein